MKVTEEWVAEGASAPGWSGFDQVTNGTTGSSLANEPVITSLGGPEFR